MLLIILIHLCAGVFIGVMLGVMLTLLYGAYHMYEGKR